MLGKWARIAAQPTFIAAFALLTGEATAKTGMSEPANMSAALMAICPQCDLLTGIDMGRS
jgi:hypothetical protein